jgi:hypothetical protein
VYGGAAVVQAVRLAVCGRAYSSVRAVRTAVCHRALTSVWQCARQCAADWQWGSVQQRGSVRRCGSMRQCALTGSAAVSVWHCAVCDSAQCVAGCAAVCGGARSNMWQSVAVRTIYVYIYKKMLTILYCERLFVGMPS